MKKEARTGFNCRPIPLLILFFVIVLIVVLSLAFATPAHADTKYIRMPNGHQRMLFEPITIVKADLGDGLTTYAVTDDNSDDLGEAFTIAVRQAGSGRSVAIIEASGERIEAAPGSPTETDILALLGLQ